MFPRKPVPPPNPQQSTPPPLPPKPNRSPVGDNGYAESQRNSNQGQRPALPPRSSDISASFASLNVNDAPPLPPSSSRPANSTQASTTSHPQTSASPDRPNTTASGPSPPPVPQRPRPVRLEDEISQQVEPRETDAPSGIPAPRTNPPSQSRLRSCPKTTSPIQFDARWYQFNGLESMRACSNCYEKHIHSSPFANKFEGVDVPGGLPRVCRFNTPRMLQIWHRGVNDNNFTPIKTYLEHRATIPACMGKAGAKGSLGIKWFAPKAGDIPHFVACEACYEDIILATHFGENFQPHPQQQQEQDVWACDLAVPFIARAIEEHSKTTRRWQDFAAAANYRLQLPPCPEKQAVHASSRKWLRTRKPIRGFVMCETCYYEYAAATHIGSEFEYRPVAEAEMFQQWTCDTALWPIRIAIEEAVEARNFNLFWDTAHTMTTIPHCANGDIRDGNWYVLADGFEGFQLCPGCYTGLIHIFGLGPYFKMTRYAPGVVQSCSFSLSSPRFTTYMLKLAEAIETFRPKVLTDYIHRYGLLPVCSRDNLVSNRKWYGTKDFVACESCYEDVIRGSRLDSQLSFHNKPIERELICCLYSPRMRKLWDEACSTNDIAGFSTICQQRTQVYMQTMVEVRNIVAAMKMRMETKMAMTMAGIMYSGGNNIVAASRPAGDHQNWGNSTVGYGFETMSGVQGAMMDRQASSMQVVQGGEYARVGYLEGLWRQVE